MASPPLAIRGTRIVATVAANSKHSFSKKLLAWYDEHARVLPWRVAPQDRAAGVRPDPYRVWLSEIMLQQTTVATVTPRFEVFVSKWPTIHDLSAAPVEEVLGEWAGLGYYARARNLHACAKVVAEEMGGTFPQTEEELKALPGIGPYTAAAIAAIAFNVPATVVDGNVDRVIVRQFAIQQPIREIKPHIYQHASGLTPKARAGDYAQAMMDLGAGVCRPKNPTCLLCPVSASCSARKQGIADAVPVKPQKAVRPTRYGIVYVAADSKGRVLTERRPAKGLFGGMAGLPGTAWLTEPPEEQPPFEGAWKEAGRVEHVLSHFRLILDIRIAKVRTEKADLFFTDDLETLPTVFRKAVAATRD